ncbi:MAG: CoA-binding protein [Ignavibacterium sp.]|uniref:CoA-binding protein n=1 Tax=Ignavibacterium sp. TaxID=2651167 RepID=UPI0040496923
MNSIKSIDNFLNQENIAVIVVSSNKKSFGTAVYFIERKTDTMSLVNGGKIEDENLYKSLTEIPHKSESVVTVIPLGETEKTIREIYLLVINQVWMQQG